MNKPRLSYSRSSVIISRPVLAVSLLLCVIAAFFGQTALAAALMFVFLLALAARVWAQLSARRLDFSIKSPAGGVFPGDEVDFELTAHNGKFMPLVWLELFAPVPQSSCMLPEDGRKPDEWECPTLEEEGASLDIVGEKRCSFIMWYDTVSASMRWRAAYSSKPSRSMMRSSRSGAGAVTTATWLQKTSPPLSSRVGASSST